MTYITRIATAAATTAGALLIAAAPSQAALVTPTVVNGNPTCADLGSGLHELKIDPPKGGTYTSADGALTVTVTTDGKSFDFSVADDELVDLAFAKGGSEGGNLYSYAPDGINADTGLIAPDTGEGSADNAALSHITFCYEPDKVAPPIDETGPAPDPEPEPDPKPDPQPEPPATTSTPEQPASPATPAATPPAAQPAAQIEVLGKVVKKKATKKAKKKATKKARKKVKRHVVRAVRAPRFAG